MEVPRLPPAPAIRAVVYDAALVKSTLEANPWLKDVLSKPLGRGFVGSWAGFLGTRGEDMHADFKGAIIDLLLDKVLTQPFGGGLVRGPQRHGAYRRSSSQSPTARPGGVRGGRRRCQPRHVTAQACQDEKGEHTRDLTDITIKRWLLLPDHALYAALVDDRLVPRTPAGRRASRHLRRAPRKARAFAGGSARSRF